MGRAGQHDPQHAQDHLPGVAGGDVSECASVECCVDSCIVLGRGEGHDRDARKRIHERPDDCVRFAPACVDVHQDQARRGVVARIPDDDSRIGDVQDLAALREVRQPFRQGVAVDAGRRDQEDLHGGNMLAVRATSTILPRTGSLVMVAGGLRTGGWGAVSRAQVGLMSGQYCQLFGSDRIHCGIPRHGQRRGPPDRKLRVPKGPPVVRTAIRSLARKLRRRQTSRISQSA